MGVAQCAYDKGVSGPPYPSSQRAWKLVLTIPLKRENTEQKDKRDLDCCSAEVHPEGCVHHW